MDKRTKPVEYIKVCQFHNDTEMEVSNYSEPEEMKLKKGFRKEVTAGLRCPKCGNEGYMTVEKRQGIIGKITSKLK